MFMESWILRVSCKVIYFARDPKYSWFHEHSKNWIHFLNAYNTWNFDIFFVRNTYGVPAIIPFYTNLAYTEISLKFLARCVCRGVGGGGSIN